MKAIVNLEFSPLQNLLQNSPQENTKHNIRCWRKQQCNVNNFHTIRQNTPSQPLKFVCWWPWSTHTRHHKFTVRPYQTWTWGHVRPNTPTKQHLMEERRVCVPHASEADWGWGDCEHCACVNVTKAERGAEAQSGWECGVELWSLVNAPKKIHRWNVIHSWETSSVLL